MIHITKRLAYAFLVASSLFAGGCYGTMTYRATAPSGGIYVETAPPEPRVEVYDTRAGYVWIQGRWNWDGGQYVWMGGHYERERAGYYWQPGRWDHRGRQYVWVDGQWGAGERREERRDERHDERRGDDRDHRH